MRKLSPRSYGNVLLEISRATESRHLSDERKYVKPRSRKRNRESWNTELLEDDFRIISTSWKDQSKQARQWGAVAKDPFYRFEIPLSTEIVIYIGSESPYFTKGGRYRAVEFGKFWHTAEFGSWLTTDDYDGIDPDYCCFVPMTEFWSLFKKCTL